MDKKTKIVNVIYESTNEKNIKEAIETIAEVINSNKKQNEEIAV